MVWKSKSEKESRDLARSCDEAAASGTREAGVVAAVDAAVPATGVVDANRMPAPFRIM